MADVASRTFNKSSASDKTFQFSDAEFLQFFSTTFPLQENSWSVFRLSTKLTSQIFSELRGKTSTLGSWLRITQTGSAIGRFGPPTSPLSLEWTPCSPVCQTPPVSNSSLASLTGSGGVTTGMALKSELAPFKSRYEPSARHSNWTDNKTPPIEAKESIGLKYNV
jgi:hypothetical protein